MESASVIALIVTVIVVGVVLMVAVQIMGATSDNVDCKILQGYQPLDLGSDGRVGQSGGTDTADTPESYTGWAKMCQDTRAQQMSAFGIVAIVAIVTAAASIMFVITRYL